MAAIIRRTVRLRPRAYVAWLIAAAILRSVTPAAARELKDIEPVPIADHHMHIQSKLISEWLWQIKAKEPTAFNGMPDEMFAERGGSDALRELDRAGIRKGVLLSAAYMFGSSGIPLTPDQLERRVRAENRFNVDAALASHGRLVAFIGVNPFLPNALEELAYWSHQPGATGVKLHLGNSHFDLGNAEQVAKLATFFRAASKARMPLVVHLRSAAPFTVANVNIFINEVLSQAGDLPVQIAHGGGYGGIDQPTLDALSAFGEAIARKAPGTAHLIFDLAAVVQLDPANLPGTRDPSDSRSSDDMRAEFVAAVRKIGLSRFVLGSDWPGLKPPAEYFKEERIELPVSDKEWKQLCSNLAPYLRPDWPRKSLARIQN